MPAIRVLVVEDHAVVRRQICELLSQDPGVEIVCQSADGEHAVAKAQELRPDIVLLDISLPGISGIEAARKIRETCPKCQIIFLSQYDTPQVAREALKTGARGYVVKSEAASDLLKAIAQVNAGNSFVSSRIDVQSLNWA